MSQFDPFRTEQIRTEREFFKERNCLEHSAKPENRACHRLSLVISFIQSNKGHLKGFVFVFRHSQAPYNVCSGYDSPSLQEEAKILENAVIVE